MASDKTALLDLAQTLTNKTLTSPVVTTPTITSPVINTGVSGTAILDENDMATDSDTQLATQQSIKAFVTSGGVTMTNKRLTAPKLNEDVSVAATATEINRACDGITATATEINTACDGITATASEINTACDGITATAAEINTSESLTSGITATAAEINSVADETNGIFSFTTSKNTSGIVTLVSGSETLIASHTLSSCSLNDVILVNTFVAVTKGGTGGITKIGVNGYDSGTGVAWFMDEAINPRVYFYQSISGYYEITQSFIMLVSIAGDVLIELFGQSYSSNATVAQNAGRVSTMFLRKA